MRSEPGASIENAQSFFSVQKPCSFSLSKFERIHFLFSPCCQVLNTQIRVFNLGVDLILKSPYTSIFFMFSKIFIVFFFNHFTTVHRSLGRMFMADGTKEMPERVLDRKTLFEAQTYSLSRYAAVMAPQRQSKNFFLSLLVVFVSYFH